MKSGLHVEQENECETAVADRGEYLYEQSAGEGTDPEERERQELCPGSGRPVMLLPDEGDDREGCGDQQGPYPPRPPGCAALGQRENEEDDGRGAKGRTSEVQS